MKLDWRWETARDLSYFREETIKVDARHVKEIKINVLLVIRGGKCGKTWNVGGHLWSSHGRLSSWWWYSLSTEKGGSVSGRRWWIQFVICWVCVASWIFSKKLSSRCGALKTEQDWRCISERQQCTGDSGIHGNRQNNLEKFVLWKEKRWLKTVWKQRHAQKKQALQKDLWRNGLRMRLRSSKNVQKLSWWESLPMSNYF